MAQIPLLSGVYADQNGAYRTSYPRNMYPVPKEQGVSNGFFAPAEGLVILNDEAPGIGRGGIEWRGVCYRVMGAKLCTVSASGGVTVLGDVGGSGPAIFDYSFDRLAIVSGGSLFYWNGSTLVRVTDPDLGTVRDVRWVDGYFMTTDGEYLVVTELDDPTAVNPLKYGSSEVDPDPVIGLLKLRNEIYALNRYTTEVFNNVGGDGFPFQRTEGAMVEAGAVGTHMKCLFGGAIALVGGGRSEPVAVYLIGSGSRQSISTAEIDQILEGYPESVLAECKIEARLWRKHEWLLIHLPDRTLVYDLSATKALEKSIWYTLDSGMLEPAQYRAQGWVWCYGMWLFDDPQAARIGTSSDASSRHYGDLVSWELATTMLYDEGRGAIVHELELVGLPGRVTFGDDPVIWTSYSLDGEKWSQERPVSAGRPGETLKRMRWMKQGKWVNVRIQRFRGTSDAHLAIARLEARVEALNG